MANPPTILQRNSAPQPLHTRQPTEHMKRNLRRFALRTLKNVGAFRLVEAGRWRQQRLLILCYHGVALADEDQWRPTLYMSSQLLERRLQVLRDGKYAVLPLPEAIDRLYRK